MLLKNGIPVKGDNSVKLVPVTFSLSRHNTDTPMASLADLFIMRVNVGEKLPVR